MFIAVTTGSQAAEAGRHGELLVRMNLALLLIILAFFLFRAPLKRLFQPPPIHLYLNSDDSVICLTLNHQGHILTLDAHGSDLLGYAGDELVGLRLSELLGPGDGEQLSGLLRMLKDQTLPEDQVLVLRSKNGQPVTLTLSTNQHYQLQHESEREHLRLGNNVLESLPDHISVVAPDYTYRHVNGTYLKAHGLERAQIEGHSVAELLGEEIFQTVVKPKLDRCLAGEEVHYESWFTFKNLGRRYMSVTYYPLRGHGKKINGVTVISRDATAIKQANEHLQLFRELMDHSNDGIIIADPDDGRIIDVNERTLHNLMYTRDELLSMQVTDISTALANDKAWEEFRSDIKRSGSRLIKAKHRRKDGSMLYIEASVRYIELGEKAYLVSQIRDIGERLEMDRQLRLARSVLENIPEGVMITNSDLEILSVNPAFSATTGYEEAEVIGQSPKILSSGRHDAAYYHDMWRAINTTGHWEGEIWNRRKDGDIYPEWLAIYTIRDAQDEVCFYAAFFSDSTSQLHVRKRLHTLAYYDPLTQLPNRLLFQDRLTNALINAERDGRPLALLFLDLDEFKGINDDYGHIVGDEVLCEVARRLRIATRASDTVSRLAGDEFTIIVQGFERDEDVEVVAHKLIKAFQEPFILNEQMLTISTSIGIALYPQDGTESQELLSHADEAMYRAKSSGRNHFVRYSNIDH